MADKGAVPKKSGFVPKQRKPIAFTRSTKINRTPPPPNRANESFYLCQICLVEDDIEKVRCDKCLLWYHFSCAKLSKDILNQDVWMCFHCVQTQQQQDRPNSVNDLIDIDTEKASGYSIVNTQRDPVLENPSGYSSVHQQSDQTVKKLPENPPGDSIVPPQRDQVLEIPPSVGHKSQSSRKPSSTASTMSRRAALALQKLEEERQLLEMRDKQAAEKQRERDREYLNQKYSILEDDEMSNLSFDDQEVDLIAQQEVDRQKFETIREWTANIPKTNNDNLLEKENSPVDNEIHLRGPQLNSTSVIHRPFFGNDAPNEMLSDVNTTVQCDTPQIYSLKVVPSKIQETLPNWLTNPITSEQGNSLPWLQRYSHQAIDTVQDDRSAASPKTNILVSATAQSNSAVAQDSVEQNQLPPQQLPTLSTNVNTSIVSSTLDTHVNQENARQQLTATFNQMKTDVANKTALMNYQNYGNHQNRQQMSLPYSCITKTSGHQIAGAQNADSTSYALNTTQQSFAGPGHQPILRPTTQFVNHLSTKLNPPNIGIVSSQMSFGTIATPALQSNYQLSNDPTRQLSANQQQLVFSQPGFGTSQSFDNSQRLGGYGQQNMNQLSRIGHTNSNSQTVTNCQTNNNGTFGLGEADGTGQRYRQSQPFVPSFGNDHERNASSIANHAITSQPQFLGTIQPHLVLSQPQHLGSSQRQYLTANQSFGTSQSFGDGQQYIISQPFRFSNQINGNSATYSQAYSQPTSLPFQNSSGNFQQYTSSSSTTRQPSMGNINYVPVSQPFNPNSSMNANNGMYPSHDNSNMTTRSAITGRLTTEQIASRHVMPRDLPQFHGDPRQWYAFISAYENSNETCGFSNNENLGRLQKCLKGDAEIAVKSRLFHKDSVPGVIETLRLLYGRPELIMEALLGDVQKMPAPKEDDLPALIKFALSVQNLSATIKHVGASEHLRNPMLINSIVDKLPPMHRLNWAFHKQTIGNVHIGHLGDWLYQMANVISQVVRVSSKPVKKQEPQKDNNKNKSDTTKSNPFLNTQVEKPLANVTSKSENKKNCPACNSSKCNKLVNCKKFKDANRAERWTIVKKGRLCGRCFGNHKFYLCTSDHTCSIDGCNAYHHALLHNFDSSSEPTSKNGKGSSETKSKEPKGEKKTCNSQRSEFTQRTDKFRIVPVMLHHNNKSVRDYAYLDDGSNMTTMEESLADELALTGTSKELCVDWAFGQTHSTVDSRIVSVKISGYFENAPRFKMTNVRTVKNLHLPTQSISTSWIDRYCHFKNVPIATYESAKPRLLIGLQYSKLTVSLETIEGKEEEPIVCRTRLGWVVQGPTFEADKSSNTQKFSINMCVCQSNGSSIDNELHQLVKSYFSMEHMGIKIPENSLESRELQRARQILDSTTVKKGDRYQTGLLWKDDDVELPDSYGMALKRLSCLETKMAKNPELKSNLFNQIKQFNEKGYIRKLSKYEKQKCKYPLWYLPTFPVFNAKKPEKIRLVWDGAAKVKNTSLNSNLLVGPDQLVPLPDLLRRFREGQVAITGDIAEMFHQIRIQESDQHAQRFLWRENPSLEPEIYVMTVMTFGSKCSPSAAQYVKNKNANEFEKHFPRSVESIVHNHYVDDMIDSANSIDEAETLVKEVKMIHQSGGFNIRNFASNSKELLNRIGENVVPQSKDLNIGSEIGTERVLGMFWDTASDNFTYSLKFTKVNENVLTGKYCPTKREVLRILMSVFDPLGLLANFLVYGKILLQEIWKSNIEWDEKITPPIRDKWSQWIQALPNVETLQIPRWYSPKLTPERTKAIQLHTFVDAGAEACAAVCYLRIEDEDGVDCCLVSSKTKVAPTKPMSIPRLELQAAVIGTRLAGNVKISQKLTFEKEVYWTDSQTVMAWINSESRRFNQFVSFRVGEILENTEPNQWHWVPTKHNVADEATKSKIIPKLTSDSRWFKAPAFLYEDEQHWFMRDKNFTTEEEMRPSFVMSVREVQPQQLFDLSRFSQWNRLVRAQAFVLRFVYNLRTSKQERRIGLLSQSELIQAENCLYQRAQRDIFLDEILILKHNEKVPLVEQRAFEKSSELRTFSPYLDGNNVLRHLGRIDAGNSIDNTTKRPIILPRRHQVTKLLVDWYHRRYKHLNHQTALNEIRQKYMIPAVRVVMKGVRSSCQKCKNANAKPMIPEMAGLPPARLAAFTRPFTFTGVDYFGPFQVKLNRSVVPRYGVIFTCLTTRAIHLEVADTLNTSSCINAVRRFSARKGEPREFFSDNGTNFHGADNDLKKEFENLEKNVIQQEFTSTEQKWTFNPPTASHMGGVWERLIQTVKRCLKQMLTTKTPTQEMLVTLMAEVENIVNSRPLTYISLDSTEDDALTPNHFLFGTSNALKPIATTTQRDLNRNDWRAVEEMTKHFWHRFVLEYLPDLTKRTKWLQQVEPIKVGDVVLVIDERYPRNTWPKGIVEETMVAKDGCIRRVMVRFGKSTLPRPVSKLAILDVKPHNNEDGVQLNPMESVNGGENVVERSNVVNTDPSLSSSATVLPYELTVEPQIPGSDRK